jgi:hypothetical protein
MQGFLATLMATLTIPAAVSMVTPALPHAAVDLPPVAPAATVLTPAAGMRRDTGGAAVTWGTAQCSSEHLPLPDPSCQPGAMNPDVTQATIGATICVPGWTSTVRPPASYTGALKARQIGEYGYRDTDAAHYEEDHLIPLELGGATRDPRNLWPEPRYEAGGRTAGDKDTVENALKRSVCAGAMTLATARDIMAADWRRGPAARPRARGRTTPDGGRSPARPDGPGTPPARRWH